MRNKLIDRLGEPAAAPRLSARRQLDDNITGFGIRGDRAATRERRTLRARYQLVELASGTVVLDATAGSDAGIDIVSSEYATVAAEQTALEQLAGRRRRPDRRAPRPSTRRGPARPSEGAKAVIGRAVDQPDRRRPLLPVPWARRSAVARAGERLFEALGASRFLLTAARSSRTRRCSPTKPAR